jgi:hypothetical protein
MTISAASQTLADFALQSNDPLVKAVTYSLIVAGNAAQDIPFITSAQMVANGVRFEGNLPTVNWAQVNSEGVTTKGTPTPYGEQVYTFRNYIDLDKLFVRDINAIQDPRSVQVGAFLRALTYDFNYKFISNDHVAGDVNAPVGLKYRINNGSVFGVRSENLIDAGTLNISQSGATQATANKFLELLDQLLWSVDSPDGEDVTLYVNEVMKRRFNFLVRLLGTSGGFSTAQDQFNRTIQMYKGAVIRDIGRKVDQSTLIIQNTENANGADDGSSNQTSIYAVNYSDDHFHGWQFEDINVQDLGLINNGVIYRTFIDWALGLMNESTRSIGRLYDLKMA